MPSTHLSLHYHLVFGTKDHAPLIQPAWRGQLRAYLGGIVRTADGVAEAVGGVSDHVHLLVGLRATHRLADVLRELKSVSSGWVHTKSARAGLRSRKATARSPSALRSERRCANTFNARRSTIARVRSTTNIARCWSAAASSLTSVICEARPSVISEAGECVYGSAAPAGAEIDGGTRSGG